MENPTDPAEEAHAFMLVCTCALLIGLTGIVFWVHQYITTPLPSEAVRAYESLLLERTETKARLKELEEKYGPPWEFGDPRAAVLEAARAEMIRVNASIPTKPPADYAAYVLEFGTLHLALNPVGALLGDALLLKLVGQLQSIGVDDEGFLLGL